MTGDHSIHQDSATLAPRLFRSRALNRLLVAVLAGAFALSWPMPGRAADYHAFLCAIPPGDIGERAQAPTDDVTYSVHDTYLFAASSCNGQGGSMYAAMRGGVTHPVGSLAAVTFTAPTGLSIAGFNLWRFEENPQTIAKPAYKPMAIIYEGETPNATSNLAYSGTASVEGPCELTQLCAGRGVVSPWYSEKNKVSASSLSGVSTIEWTAGCRKGGPPCPASGEGRSAGIYVFSLDVILDDPTPPAIEETRGSILAGGAFSGEQGISLTATDAGSGVYSAWIDVDGTRMTGPTLLNTNSGSCEDMGASKDDLRSFDHPRPCLPRASGLLSLNTAALKDGQHQATLHVDNAAGSQATSTWTFVSDNAPLIQTAPVVTGSAQVGSTLTGTNGSFSAPPGAGTLSGATGQWLRCTGEACSPIGGATSTTYTPITEDLHHTIVYQNTVSDSDGETVADSLPTLEVQEALTPSLGSITVNIPNQALVAPNNGLTALGSSTPWNVSLNVAPRRVHLHTTIHLTGRIATSPRPAGGKLIYLQARTSSVTRKRGRRVRVYGEWVTFQALRAHSNGTFSFAHLVRVGGPHTYQFRAVAPSEGQYHNHTGASASITVTET